MKGLGRSQTRVSFLHTKDGVIGDVHRLKSDLTRNSGCDYARLNIPQTGDSVTRLKVLDSDPQPEGLVLRTFAS